MKYLYYTLYRHFSNVKSNDTPAFNAMVLISALQAVNIQTLLLLFTPKIRFNFQTKNQVVTYAVIIGISLFVLNFFLLIKKLPELKNKYKNESLMHKNIGTGLLLFYIIATVLSIYLISVHQWSVT